MREIKFRAWDGEKIYTPHYLSLNAEYNALIFDNGFRLENGAPNKSAILMQYTGLKDKNGKEIYEGDLYKWGDDTGVVVFESGCFVFRLSDNYSMTMRDHDIQEIEIIGNKFETPDLIN